MSRGKYLIFYLYILCSSHGARKEVVNDVCAKKPCTVFGVRNRTVDQKFGLEKICRRTSSVVGARNSVSTDGDSDATCFLFERFDAANECRISYVAIFWYLIFFKEAYGFSSLCAVDVSVRKPLLLVAKASGPCRTIFAIQ